MQFRYGQVRPASLGNMYGKLIGNGKKNYEAFLRGFRSNGEEEDEEEVAISL